MNTLEVKVIKGILSSMICFGVAGLIIETQIISLDLRLRKVEKNLETTNEKDLKNEQEDAE